ncbi:hypothetical protein JOH51_006596 [Rhizobium leguminosarum]|nr:hypothetical protein [Rhizobium leguminosarum]
MMQKSSESPAVTQSVAHRAEKLDTIDASVLPIDRRDKLAEPHMYRRSGFLVWSKWQLWICCQ